MGTWGLLGNSRSQTQPWMLQTAETLSEPHSDPPAGIPVSRALLVLAPCGDFFCEGMSHQKTTLCWEPEPPCSLSIRH